MFRTTDLQREIYIDLSCLVAFQRIVKIHSQIKMSPSNTIRHDFAEELKFDFRKLIK